MEEITIIIGILSLLLSAATLIAMVFGVRLGKKALAKSETLFGQEAIERFTHLKNTLSPDLMFGPYEYAGGNKSTPQFEVERISYDPRIMGPEWKDCSKSVRYYFKDENNKIMVQGWRLK